MSKPTLKVSELLEAGFVMVGEWGVSGSRLTCSGTLPDEPGVYAFSISDTVQYIGLASKSLRKRLYFYGNPGVSQTTNVRLKALITDHILAAPVAIYVAIPPSFEWNGLKISGAEGLEAGLIATFDLPWNMKGTGVAILKPNSQHRTEPQFHAAKQTAATRVEELIRQRPRMTEAEIAKALFGAAAYQQKVNGVCRALIAKGRIKRLGVGGINDPYVYVGV